MPQVSVIMPVYNGEKFLAEAIDSMLRQSFSDFELLIIDDGSRDGTAAVIEDYAERDARIRFIQLPENKGEAIARNTGVAHAAGALVTGMDSDDISLPQRLEKQVAFLRAHPGIGAVGVSHRVCAEDMTPILSPQLPQSHHSIVLSYLLNTRTALKCAPLMVRRENLDIEPVFDPNIGYGPDMDHVLRLLSLKNIRLANLPDVLYLLRRHANTMGSQNQARLRDVAIQLRLKTMRQLGERGVGVEWILRKHPLTKLSWSERRRARRDITRLIAALAQQNWVDAEDEPLLYAEMEQLVESTSPRYWQMFLHWYRYRVGRRFDA